MLSTCDLCYQVDVKVKLPVRLKQPFVNVNVARKWKKRESPLKCTPEPIQITVAWALICEKGSYRDWC